MGKKKVIPCNTIGDLAIELRKQFQETKANFHDDPIQFRETQYVPILFHITSKNNGSEAASEAKVLDQLCAINDDFADINIQFFLKDGGFNYIRNTTVYTDHSRTEGSIMGFNADSKAINVFIVENACRDCDPNSGVITLAYYQTILDWIVMRKDGVGSSTQYLSHELGHYFSLLHTHDGWDFEPWTVDKFGGKKAPIRTVEGILVEKADGSNCETAGDQICDTPADYNGLGFSTCDFQEEALDPDGSKINPDENLFMSYFHFCSRDNYYFSDMQQEIITTNFNSSRRNAIRNAPDATNLEIITESPSLVSPIGGETVAGYDKVTLQWSAVANADNYLVEIDNLPNFSSSKLIRFILNSQSAVTVDGLSPDKLYFWRVRPYNAYSTCTGFSSFQTFKTGTTTSIDVIKSINGWSVFPNPLKQDQDINISLDVESSLDS